MKAKKSLRTYLRMSLVLAIPLAACTQGEGQRSSRIARGAITEPPGNELCLACHDGQGEGLTNRTPPSILPGWITTAEGEGDWHGARVGVPGGGFLLPPYAWGQGPLPCTDCHVPHSSLNAFEFAPVVNGVPIPPATIERSGVGAEALCNACHSATSRHYGCTGCHPTDPNPPGSPCFACHGHEGLTNLYTSPFDCDNCHSINIRPVEILAPVISAATISSVTDTSATFQWTTDERSTSYVEYGVRTANSIAGSALLVGTFGGGGGEHTVTVTGLAPATTYVWRVRSSDDFRNVAESPIATFTTLASPP